MSQKLFSHIRVLCGLFLIFIAAPATASSGAWTVTQKSGQVEVIRAGMHPASVDINSSLNAGDTVVTGSNGRAMLARGSDYVLISANSRLTIPVEKRPDGFTRLKQWFGSVFYSVETTGKPHFEVETPLLAAVVKGTQFTVSVEADRASVRVTEGVVEVSTADRLASRDVEAGTIATVSVGTNGVIDLTPAFDHSAEPDQGVPADRASSVSAAFLVPNNLPGAVIPSLPLQLSVDHYEGVAPQANSVVSGSALKSAALDALSPHSVDQSLVVGTKAVEGASTALEDTHEKLSVEMVDEILSETSDAVTEVVEEAMSEVVEENIEAVVDIVDEAVGDVVSETVSDAVDEVVDDTVEEAVEEVVEEAVEEVVEEAVEEVVEEAVEEVVEEAVEEVVEEAVEEVVEEAVEGAVEETVSSLLGG